MGASCSCIHQKPRIRSRRNVKNKVFVVKIGSQKRLITEKDLESMVANKAMEVCYCPPFLYYSYLDLCNLLSL